MLSLNCSVDAGMLKKHHSRRTLPNQQKKRFITMLDTTSFIGREKEYTDIQQLLAQPDCRLLTLIGPGGIGKTRLALQLSALIGDKFARGAFVVYLQPVRAAEFFVSTAADALGVSLTGQEPPLAQLAHYLSDKEAFIIMDNFEHLLDAAEQLATLLSDTPHVKYLITSREALNLQEEWLYPVSGLPFPTGAATEQKDDAVQLFNERAQRVYPDFSPDKEVDAVIQICRLVEGMPLALELAAAWRKTLNCQEIAAEIQGGLAFLTTRLRNVSARHHSMQTVFDQTWQRLNEQEQAVFKRLSVFRGGFQRDAAVQITEASLPILSVLVDKSLLRLDGNGRYQIHELLRQYGAEKLSENASDLAQTQAAHANFFIQFLQRRSGDVTGRRQREALLEIRADLDNIRVAWLWAVAQGDADALQKGSESLGLYYQFSGGYLEGMTLFSQATAVIKAQPLGEAADLALLGTRMYEAWYYLRFGQQEGTEACMAHSQAIYRRLNIPPLPGYLTDPNAPLSFVALTRGDYETAVHYAEQVRDAAEAHNHPINRQFAYHLLSEAHVGLGAYETAQKFAQQAYAQSLITGDRWFRAYILNNMGQISMALGDNRLGKSHFQSSYEIRHDFADPEGMALALVNLGNLAFKEQALAEAEEAFQRSRTIYQDINDKGGLAAANWGLGRVSFEQGDFARTQGYFKEALQLAAAIDYRPVLFGLLVNIAELLWRIGQRERPLTLLAYTIHNPQCDHETRQKAQTLLTTVYQNKVSPALLANATAQGQANDLAALTADLLHQLSLPSIISPAEPALPPELAETLIEPLTPRELEVLSLLCEGQTNGEIAAELGIALGTVKFYTGQIYGKMGVRNRVTAVARARQLNLITHK
jgi:predicted ATPase/DNA-binding NarL/FixJ family response regulator